MKKLVYIFAAMLTMLLHSCGCQYHIKRLSARGCATASVSDSVTKTDSISETVVEKVVYKDTTIYTTVQGPIQYLPNPCKELCDSVGNLKPFHREVKKNGITSTIFSIGNVLAVDCKTDSLKQVIKLLQKEVERTRNASSVTVKSHSATVPVHIRTWYEQTCVYGFWTLFVLFGLLLFRRYRSGFKHLSS